MSSHIRISLPFLQHALFFITYSLIYAFLICWLILSLLHCFYVQIEWLTAGECIAGMHEVVVTNRTIEAIKLATEQNRSLWRVSSTVSNLNHTFIIITTIVFSIKLAFEEISEWLFYVMFFYVFSLFFFVICSCSPT